MKKLILFSLAILACVIMLSPSAEAAKLDMFDDQLSELRGSLSDEALEKLDELGFSGDIEDIGGLDLGGVFAMLCDTLAESAASPLSAAAIVLFAVVMSSLLDAYTHSLRYTETREVSSLIASLFIITQLIAPIGELIHSAISAVSAASGLMLIYVPLMIGILSFGGSVSSAGGCVTVMTVSQAVSSICSGVLAPGLSALLAISASSGLSGRLRLRAVCDMIYSVLKWSLVSLMTIYTAVLSMQTALNNAADSAASKVARFTLSSAIPLIGSSVSEAYRAIRSGLDLLRSGAGVFVILALMVTLLPLIIRSAMWLAAVKFSGYAAETLGADSCREALASISTALSALIAIIVCAALTFIISSAVLLSAGGSA